VIGGVVGAVHDDPADALFQRRAIDVVGHGHVGVLGDELGVAVVLPGVGVHAGGAHEAAVDDGVGPAEVLAIGVAVRIREVGDDHVRHRLAVGALVPHVHGDDVPALGERLEHALGDAPAGAREHDATLGHHLPSTILWVCVPSPWMPMTTTSP